jgi:asparagine synthase (glutamine-hydrolysing)
MRIYLVMDILHNKQMIRNILTLRYHPDNISSLPTKNWTDFIEYEGISALIHPLLSNTIKRIISTNQDKRIGLTLSGGVDSTTVLALIRQNYPDLSLKTFCVTFGEDDREAQDAQLMSELYSTDHQHIVIDNPFKDFKKQIELVNEPRWNLYGYHLFKEVSKDCDVLLTGDGGDELFGGYVFRYNKVLSDTSNESLVQKYLAAHGRDWVPDQKDIFKFGFEWQDIYSLFNSYFNNPLSKLGQIFLADYNGKLLYDFAPTSEAFSSYFNLKTIAPLLEPEIINIASHIPNRLKYDHKNNLGKILLRQILLENYGYKAAIKEKMGWTVDTIEQWETHFKNVCADLLSSSYILETGIVDLTWLKKGYERANRHEVNYVNKMIGLYALELWITINYE